MGGFLVPPWYETEKPDPIDQNISSIIWGFSIACAIFTSTKASRQTWRCIRKNKTCNTYIYLIWAEWIACVTISIVAWLFLWGTIPPSFWIFFAILCLWTVQMQCILQIIINRVALILESQQFARRLKIGVFLVISLINISVFCIWIPARLQINATYVRINEVWDRLEKAIFAVIDGCLNAYFMYLVRTRLISAGLGKYRSLFRFNAMMVCISLSLDIILIGVMSLESGVVYMEFHPLVYLVKLHIELNMAELIAKIVQASNPINAAPRAQAAVASTDSGTQYSNNSTLVSRNRYSGQVNKTTPEGSSTEHMQSTDIGVQQMRFSGTARGLGCTSYDPEKTEYKRREEATTDIL